MVVERQFLRVGGMDGIYTPTEAFFITDKDVDPKMVIGDLLARAKYYFLGVSISLTVSETLGKAAQIQVERPE